MNNPWKSRIKKLKGCVYRSSAVDTTKTPQYIFLLVFSACNRDNIDNNVNAANIEYILASCEKYICWWFMASIKEAIKPIS